MSHVTSIILTTALADSEKAMEIINAWLTKNNYGTFTQIDGHAGGHKAMQIDVYAGAFNYLDHEEFATVLKSCPFEWPEEVTLLVNGEHDDVVAPVTLNAKIGTGYAAKEIEATLRQLGETPETPFTIREVGERVQ